MTVEALVAVGIAYLLGSIDFAVVVSRARGVDIYQVGSGNPGTANVLRALGKKEAVAVLLGDTAKGVAAAWVGEALGGSQAAGWAAGLAAVVGHCFPVWHRFRGGKGVATAVGVLLWLAPPVAAAMVVVYLVVVRLSGISSLGSLSGTALSLPAVALAGGRGWELVWLAGLVVLIFARHQHNIRRLLRRQEMGLGIREG
ncbi:MAG: glycerol-3-phosphate 1-O-acyltransferase PlsY [Actinomycetota bacterium]|nr:glycerol-3-phosphate 1-O-acyltransferase PlsY [Actinomycetota bacterium]